MSESSKALVIANLGSPDSYSVADVKKYLREFLMDERVIDVPWLYRQLLVKGIIVPFRAAKSAEAYKLIWREKGSPLKVITEEFNHLLQPKLQMPSVVAMRYANPTPKAALQQLDSQPKELLIAPMYPHYAMSSYETALLYVKEQVKPGTTVKVLKPFYNEPSYIAALANIIQPYISQQQFDGYLFSYHGLPIRHLKKTDPTKSHCYSSNACCELASPAWKTCYKHQAKTTTRLVTEKLNLDAGKVMISFQSRLGSGWIEPFTDVLFEELPKKGVKKLLVITPSFVTDCLETLEEINIRGRKSFMDNGGETFVAVPCLNTSPGWLNTFADWCNNYETTYSHLWD